MLTTPAIKEMQIKIPLTPVRIAIIKILPTTNSGEDTWKKEQP
jgi:hypothetical protein